MTYALISFAAQCESHLKRRRLCKLTCEEMIDELLIKKVYTRLGTILQILRYQTPQLTTVVPL